MMQSFSVARPAEFFRVQLPTGAIRTLSLDELDDWYQTGQIDEETYVLRSGTAQWTKLGELAGIDPEPQGSATSAEPSMPVAPWPPAVAACPPSEPPPSVGLYSVRPVVSDIGGGLDSGLDDVDAPPAFRSGLSKRWVVLGVAAALILGGLGMAATRGTSTRASASAANVSSNLVAAPLPAANPPPAAAAPAGDPTKDSRLTEDQKRALGEADKSRAARLKARSVAPARSTHKATKVFHKGGNKYDPLNSSL
jgi:hypothetical protein